MKNNLPIYKDGKTMRTYLASLENITAICFAVILTACGQTRSTSSGIEDVAGNKEVAAFMKSFEGRGALSDSSTGTAPAEALAAFTHPADLALDLVLSEPAITQPLHMSFDHRGRLWVVQYNQYPYPKGLKVTQLDQYLRATYDALPKAPPDGVKGADKITVFEDTDGDGKYDKSTDAITGLNMATSMVLGRKKIWVLDPPYLLAYPDPNGDGLPDGKPEVHLSGFGLEDTHAVANSLRWGPDGWLYGAQGSTSTANVTSRESKNVVLIGQGIWRYHPESGIFEVYAEGGGNTFYVEIDDKGRFYSGHNGNERGQYYKQGAYYIKNVDKHGPVSNAYAFGFLPNMKLTGDKLRFTHAFIRYQGAGLPSRFNDQMIAINPLQNFVQLSTFDANGSTFSNKDQQRILETKDHWFRPVDIKMGPDGAVYLADWYDSRLSHIDPRDTWDKGSGRIYRLRKKDGFQPAEKFDLSTASNDQLLRFLRHPNKWFRQQALQQFAERKDKSVLNQLRNLLVSGDAQVALESLWAIHLTGGFNDDVARMAINHRDPFVRMWAVRLLGDKSNISASISTMLVQLAAREQHAEVRSQLAASAKRLPAEIALPLIKNLVMHHDDANDPDIPLQTWWALESKVQGNKQSVISLFEDPMFWQRQLVSRRLALSLMHRLIMDEEKDNQVAAARLFRLAPSEKAAAALIRGLQEGLRGKDAGTLRPELLAALQPYKSVFEFEWLSLILRQGDDEAVQNALGRIQNPQVSISEKTSLIRTFAEINKPAVIPILLNLVENKSADVTLRVQAIQALQQYDKRVIGERLVKAYPVVLSHDTAMRTAALNLFSTRASWAKMFLDAAETMKKARVASITEVPIQVVRQFRMLNDKDVAAMVERLWPEASNSVASAKNEQMKRIAALIKSGKGSAAAGKALYINRCGSCHRLFEQGGSIGPDLTGYDRRNLNELLINIIDPSTYIREGYVMSNITTTDGRTILGSIKSRNGNTITVQPLNGELILVPVSRIKTMKESNASLMPEGLLNDLTEQQKIDFFAYLMKQQ